MIAIIIINYNTYEKTIDCINSIRNTCKIPYKIYLIDNASSNESADILQNEFGNSDDVIVILSKENLGYAKGNNICIKKAIDDGFKYAVISNNDIIFEEDSIETLYNEISKDEYMIVGPKVITPEGITQKSIRNSSPIFFRYIIKETYISSLLRKLIKEEQMPDKKMDVYWVSGCAFAANLDLFSTIGLFDENTFLYFEEYILAEKAKKAGLKMEYFPEARLFHYHGYSMGGHTNIVTRAVNLRSEMYFLSNYMNWNIIKLKIIKFIRMMEVRFNLRKDEEKNEKWKKYKLECSKIK